ncbi:RNA-binding protein 25-like [Cynara cardunculus var. scolymus]|uniref:RNA-binding protein 25-like n=1 Tax=Cynara cardunculus var. scolymus TaxID=59895 RepID=UPI000D6315E6|nr:RNA-binding protein 25-like [Cynara cardunculus var. scolymus]
MRDTRTSGLNPDTHRVKPRGRGRKGGTKALPEEEVVRKEREKKRKRVEAKKQREEREKVRKAEEERAEKERQQERARKEEEERIRKEEAKRDLGLFSSSEDEQEQERQDVAGSNAANDGEDALDDDVSRSNAANDGEDALYDDVGVVVEFEENEEDDEAEGEVAALAQEEPEQPRTVNKHIYFPSSTPSSSTSSDSVGQEIEVIEQEVAHFTSDFNSTAKQGATNMRHSLTAFEYNTNMEIQKATTAASEIVKIFDAKIKAMPPTNV